MPAIAPTTASFHAPVLIARSHPPAACICPLMTSAMIGASAQVIQRSIRSNEERISEWKGA